MKERKWPWYGKKVRDKVAEKRGRKKFKGNMGGSKIVAVHVSSGK